MGRPWFVPKLRCDHLLVSPGNGVVSSKRWEAVCDGIEDYARLALLREKLANRRTAAQAEEVAAAKRLRGEDAAGFGGVCVLEHGNTFIRLGDVAKRRAVADSRWNDIQRLRRERARLLEALEWATHFALPVAGEPNRETEMQRGQPVSCGR